MEKYLRVHAEPETAALTGMDAHGGWANVLVVPARNESPEFLRLPPPCSGRSLLILVINESLSCSPPVSSGNQALAATVRKRCALLWQNQPKSSAFGLELLRDPDAPRDVLLVDRFSEGRKLPAKSGVGHARKIGADLAAALISRESVHSDWIHCSDADVCLPGSYFRCSDGQGGPGQGVSALVYPFRHRVKRQERDRQAILLAIQLYEISLRYYVAGLKFAQSPYAFHTIGSTMAVNAGSYAKVRGFPKRQAGEDFYLLNKLAKIGPVKELRTGPDCEPIEIEARRSDRVPFGTGAAVNRIAGMADPVATHRFYHPEVFMLLERWLKSWPAIWHARPVKLVVGDPGGIGELTDRYGLDGLPLDCLWKIGVGQALKHAFGHSGNLEQFSRHLHTWFDAFRTVKLIHALRDRCLPSVPFAELGTHSVFSQLLAQDQDLAASCRALRSNPARL